MVLELAKPAEWEQLSKVWRGVQSDLELPAPGIAVSGVDGFQLWFSLEQPIAADHARSFVQSLCSRYLPDIAPNRLRLTPVAATGTMLPAQVAPTVPALQPRTGYWSAFVTADLAPIFADTPWVESAPSDDGQAGVLSHLASISAPAFDTACERLGLAQVRVEASEALPLRSESTALVDAAVTSPEQPGTVQEQLSRSARELSPRQFLLQVMNDDQVALGLRIEAAKALLPYFAEQGAWK